MNRRALRGALVISPASGPSRTVVFQYNPAALTRRLVPQTVGGDPNARSAALAFTAAPQETLQVQVEVDASDQVDLAPADLARHGIRPLLDAIETILYPSAADVAASAAKLQAGVLEIGAYRAPTVVFSWGERAAPVRLVGCTITEQAFSAELHPIRAQVDLELQVVRYSDVLPGDAAYGEFAAYHRDKERLALLGGREGA